MAGPSTKPYSMSSIKSKLLRPALTSHFICAFNIPDLLQGEPREPGSSLKEWLKQKDAAGLAGIQYSSDDVELLQISCSEASLPGSSLITNQIDNDYYGVTERHAYRRQYDDRIDFTFYVDRDYKIIKFFEGWISYIVNERINAGENAPGEDAKTFSYRVRFPDSYQTDNLYITKFERDINTPNPGPSLTYRFIRAYPININSMPVSYDSSDLLKCTVSFTYSRYIVNRTINRAPDGSLSGSFTNPNSPLSQATERALNPGSGPGFSNPEFDARARAALGI